MKVEISVTNNVSSYIDLVSITHLRQVSHIWDTWRKDLQMDHCGWVKRNKEDKI